MEKWCVVLALLLSGSLNSCAPPESQQSGAQTNDPAVEVTAVERVIDNWINAANANDPDKVLSLVCDNVEAIPPDHAPVTGADAHQLYRGFFEPYNFAFNSNTTELVVSGDWALRRYSYNITLTPKAGGDPISMQGHGIHIFHREADGSWCVAKDMWNSVPAESVSGQGDR